MIINAKARKKQKQKLPNCKVVVVMMNPIGRIAKDFVSVTLESKLLTRKYR